MIARRCLAVCTLFASSACTVMGPDYKRPPLPVPQTFEHTGPWRQAAPSDLIARGDWWRLFQDPVLDDLQERARRSSPTLAIHVARIDQARSIAGVAGSFQYPDVGVGATAGRFGASGNRPDQPEKRPGNHEYQSGLYRAPITAGYEIDLWGRVRRLNESARAQADAALAEYQTVALSLEAEITTLYLRLRQTEEERRLIGANLSLQRRARDLTVARRNGGLATELDVARLDTELALTEAAAEDARRRRDDLELALASAVGEIPEGFHVAESSFAGVPPVVPVGLPADLLERRPDVVEAERRLVARNADIGVAQAAYFPAIRLTGSVGFESGELSQFLQGDSLIWSMGASLFQPVFNAGRLRFDAARAKAVHAEAVAQYRLRLLRAFREVEGALAALHSLDDQARLQEGARTSAAKAVRIAESRYRAGLVSVLEVIDAQRSGLRADREALAVRGNQMVTTVSLVKALGGGWEARSAEPARSAALSP